MEELESEPRPKSRTMSLIIKTIIKKNSIELISEAIKPKIKERMLANEILPESTKFCKMESAIASIPSERIGEKSIFPKCNHLILEKIFKYGSQIDERNLTKRLYLNPGIQVIIILTRHKSE